MDYFSLLFRLKGRIGRLPMWIFSAVYLACWLSMALCRRGMAFPWLQKATAVAFFIVMGLSLWISFVLMWKRLHDRNKSAKWLWLFWGVPVLSMVLSPLLFVFAWGIADTGPARVPVLTSILYLIVGAIFTVEVWAFIELWCLPGTAGENKYGPDPRENRRVIQDFGA